MKDKRCITIYKYRSLSGEYGREAIERAIIHNELYWQSPAEFNDAFDCVPVLYFGDNADERQRYYVREVDARCNGQPRFSRRRCRREIAGEHPSLTEKRLQNNFHDLLLRSAVTCFSELNDNPLMWAHYADSHKGVCLIFNEIANQQIEWFCFQVKYQAGRPRIILLA